MKNYCTKCGKENKKKTGYCEYCGELMVPEKELVNTSVVLKTNSFATAAFITSLVSISCNLFMIGSIVSIVLSIVALVKIKNGEGTGKKFAITALVIGICEIVFTVLCIVLLPVILKLLSRL